MKFEESMSAYPTMYVVMNKWFTPMVFFLFLNFMILTIYVTSGFADKRKKPEQQLSQSPPSMLTRLKSIEFYQFASFNTSLQPASMTLTHVHLDKNEDGKNSQQLGRGSSINWTKLVKMSSGSISTFRHFREAEAMENSKKSDGEVHIAHTTTNDYNEGEGAGQNDGVHTVNQNDDEVFEAEQNDVVVYNEEEGGRSMNEVFSALERQGSNMINRTKSDTEPASGVVTMKLVKKIKKSASTRSPFKHFEEVDILEARRPATVNSKSEVDEEEEEGVDSKADDFINKFKNELKLQRLDSILRYKEMLDRGVSR